MLVQVDAFGTRITTWHDYVLRFLFGGAITAAAGIIAKLLGPEIGGIFLAFPAIFPAAATLTQKQEIEKKEQKGLSGRQRGIDAAGAQAAGTAIGSIGLAAFAAVLWGLILRINLWTAFPTAVIVWIAISTVLWFARKRWSFVRRKYRRWRYDHEPA